MDVLISALTAHREVCTQQNVQIKHAVQLVLTPIYVRCHFTLNTIFLALQA